MEKVVFAVARRGRPALLRRWHSTAAAASSGAGLDLAAMEARDDDSAAVAAHWASVESAAATAIAQNQADERAWMHSPSFKTLTSGFARLPLRHLSANSLRSVEAFAEDRLSPTLGLGSPADRETHHRILSQLLSFPLSLSLALHHLPPAKEMARPLKVLLLGARAEVSLPHVWWKELLAAAPQHHPHIELRMMGCDHPLAPGTSTVWTESLDRRLAFAPLPRAKELFHQHPDRKVLLDSTDLFVLFNPGLGSPSLQAGWRSTLDLLLRSQRPIALTAHSERDLLRDLRTIRQAAADQSAPSGQLEMLLPPQLNPMASRKLVLDPKEQLSARVAQCNKFLYVLRWLPSTSA